jgi:hypothetical protein
MEEKGFIVNLREGNFGLATTYWLYFIIGGNILFFIAGAVPILFLVYIPYQVIVLMGVWNSAKKYKGSIIWSGLAQLIVVLNILMILGLFLSLIGSQNHGSSYEQYEYQQSSTNYGY